MATVAHGVERVLCRSAPEQDTRCDLSDPNLDWCATRWHGNVTLWFPTPASCQDKQITVEITFLLFSQQHFLA